MVTSDFEWAAYLQARPVIDLETGARSGWNMRRTQMIISGSPVSKHVNLWSREQENDSSRARWRTTAFNFTDPAQYQPTMFIELVLANLRTSAFGLDIDAPMRKYTDDDDTFVIATLKVPAGTQSKCLENRGAPWPLLNRFKPRMLDQHGISI